VLSRWEPSGVRVILAPLGESVGMNLPFVMCLSNSL
jgi:hypothetical protein